MIDQPGSPPQAAEIPQPQHIGHRRDLPHADRKAQGQAQKMGRGESFPPDQVDPIYDEQHRNQEKGQHDQQKADQQKASPVLPEEAGGEQQGDEQGEHQQQAVEVALGPEQDTEDRHRPDREKNRAKAAQQLGNVGKHRPCAFLSQLRCSSFTTPSR